MIPLELLILIIVGRILYLMTEEKKEHKPLIKRIQELEVDKFTLSQNNEKLIKDNHTLNGQLEELEEKISVLDEHWGDSDIELKNFGYQTQVGRKSCKQDE